MDFTRIDQRSGNSAPVLNKTEARQGVTGHNVRYVVMLGIAAVVVGFIIAYTVVHALFA
jgi:hypothetical protein